VVNAREAPAVKWIFGAAAEGMLPLAIAEEANARGSAVSGRRARSSPRFGIPFTLVCSGMVAPFDPAITSCSSRRTGHEPAYGP